MKENELSEAIEALESVYEILQESLRRVRETLVTVPEDLRLSAERGWLSYLEAALSEDHDHVGGPTVTLEDTLLELKKRASGG